MTFGEERQLISTEMTEELGRPGGSPVKRE
jgi:hypothetical protein